MSTGNKVNKKKPITACKCCLLMRFYQRTNHRVQVKVAYDNNSGLATKIIEFSELKEENRLERL
jgi:hypothetical protein